MTKLEKKALSVGPGGVKCACCFPAPGTPERRKLYKRARRKVEEMLIREGLEMSLEVFREMEDSDG